MGSVIYLQQNAVEVVVMYFNISFFAGVVSMAGIEPGLWSVKGGNKKVPELLQKHAKANLIQGEVTTVRLIDDEEPTYEIDYKCSNCNNPNEVKTREYDLVVVAVPLHRDVSSIKFEGFPTEIKNFPQTYHTLTASMVKGRPNTTYFGLNCPDEFPTELLVGNKDNFFNSIGTHNPVTDKTGSVVYKVFSNTPPGKEQLSTYFDKEEDIRMIHWQAYPEYNFNPDSLPPFVLHDKLYYVNSIELAASAMEMVTIGAKNVALLAHHHWTGNLDKIDEPYSAGGDGSKTEL